MKHFIQMLFSTAFSFGVIIIIFLPLNKTCSRLVKICLNSPLQKL